jgi:hypothetical protein
MENFFLRRIEDCGHAERVREWYSRSKGYRTIGGAWRE